MGAVDGSQHDVVMLDPPSFTKTRDNIQKAITGYKEINLRGMKLVKPGGFLVTSSCTNLVPACYVPGNHTNGSQRCPPETKAGHFPHPVGRSPDRMGMGKYPLP